MKDSDELVLVKKFEATGPWALDVKQRVDREAVQEWAQRPAPAFRVIPPMKVESWSLAPAFAFIRSVIP